MIFFWFLVSKCILITLEILLIPLIFIIKLTKLLLLLLCKFLVHKLRTCLWKWIALSIKIIYIFIWFKTYSWALLSWFIISLVFICIKHFIIFMRISRWGLLKSIKWNKIIKIIYLILAHSWLWTWIILLNNKVFSLFFYYSFG